MAGPQPESFIGGGLGTTAVWLAAAIWQVQVIARAPGFAVSGDRMWLVTELWLAALGLAMVALGVGRRWWRERRIRSVGPGTGAGIPPAVPRA